MKTRKRNWLPGAVAILLLIGIPVWFFTSGVESNIDTPWENMPRRAAHVDHKNRFDGLGELETGPQVTAA
jgi:hypothetical protein